MLPEDVGASEGRALRDTFFFTLYDGCLYVVCGTTPRNGVYLTAVIRMLDDRLWMFVDFMNFCGIHMLPYIMKSGVLMIIFVLVVF